MKFLKRLMSKRNNAGFTLVEIVVSVALLGILLVGMTMFVTPVLRQAGGTQTDIRASILAETLEAYIDRSVKNARYVAVFDGVANKASPTQRTNDLQNIYDSNELEKFKNFFNGDNDSKYEVRCIGINWEDDERTNEQKYMLKLWKVTKGTGDKFVLSRDNKVFEDCFYDGLFPELTATQLVSTDDGSKAPALKLTVDVYSDDAMTNMAMSGDGYAQLINISKNDIDSSMFFKSLDDAGTKIHSDIYIFYITRKTF